MADGVWPEVLIGDALSVLRTLPDESVHCVITSPPYWALRSYLPDGHEDKHQEIGLDPSVECWVETLVEVFREVKRVLRKDGTVWLNLGDSYACSPNGRKSVDIVNDDRTFRDKPFSTIGGSIKNKDLVGQPWRLAFALQADGWWLRSDIIWSKPNCMPSSVEDRPTTAHEYLFLLAKSGKPTFWVHRDGKGSRTAPQPDYRWVNEATGAEQDTDPGDKEQWRRLNLWRGHDYWYDADAIREPHRSADDPRNRADYQPKRGLYDSGRPDGMTGPSGASTWPAAGRNKRTVWEIATQPSPFAHFACFPEALVEPCILAGTSEAGCCPECGAPWKRTVEKPFVGEWKKSSQDPKVNTQKASGADVVRLNGTHYKAGYEPAKTIGWAPTCAHPHPQAALVPCTVLDPFAGSGTTLRVATRLGRRSIGIELSEEYARTIIAKRTAQGGLGI